MRTLTKFSALTVASLATIGTLVIVLALLETKQESVAASATPVLFDQDLIQEIYERVSPAVFVIKADRKQGDSFVTAAYGSGFLIDQQGYIVTNQHVILGADRLIIEFGDGGTV